MFGQGGTLVGILTDPPRPTGVGDRPAVVLLNAGFIHRVGPYRLNVNLARSLAAAQFPVLRFDLSGIGDSRLRRDNLPIQKSAVLEAQEAMAFLTAARGATRFVLIGLCSGAENALRVARLDKRVIGAVALNYQGDPTDQVIKDRYHADYYRRAMFDPRRWLRAARGESEYGSIVRLLGVRLWSGLSGKARRSPRAAEIGASLRELSVRGVRVCLLFNEGDPGLDYLNFYLAKDIDRLKAAGGFDVQVVPRANHMFGPLRAQEHVIGTIETWLQQTPAGQRATTDRQGKH